MSNLRSAIEELQLEDVRRLGQSQLEDDLRELELASRALVVERSRRVAEVDRRREFEADGYLSTTAWMVDRIGAPAGASAGAVRTARALEEMPRTREALAAGDLSETAARILIATRETHPDEFAAAEETLVDAAVRVDGRDLHRVVEYWRQAIDAADGTDPDERARERRRLHISQTIFGMVRLDADLDPETGAYVIAALRAVLDHDARTRAPHDGRDLRTPAQRRADAIGEVCRQWLDNSDRPKVAGERPHVTVVLDAHALKLADGSQQASPTFHSGSDGRNAGRRAELEETGPIGPESIRRLTCDAAITRVVTAGPSEPIDVGRRTPVVPPATRRAVAVRDGGCVFHGCTRPPSWCDVHHVRHWADGGETSLANLAMLCRPHHRSIHAGRFRIMFVDRRPRAVRIDGSSLDERAPP